MQNVETPIAAQSSEPLNVADRLAEFARNRPHELAVVCPARWSPKYTQVRRNELRRYATTTFAKLDADATRIARGLAAWGVPRGTRLALLVRPGIEFVALVFGLLRAGMVIVLVDPGLGKRNMVRCLSEAEPEGFVAVSAAQAARLWWRKKFSHSRWNVTVGRRWFWGGLTLEELRRLGAQQSPSPLLTRADDSAAIIFTSGSTGAPKGVLYTHRMFDTQVHEIKDAYQIAPGGIDLACFPLFALFNSAMGVTTVLPEMDFSRPASADPKKVVQAANDWEVTQAFASPAVWRVVSNYCAKTGAWIPSLQQIFSCGAPVTAYVLKSTLACVADGARMHTPYGATECLPVATIEAAEVLSETAAATDQGHGICLGRKFESIEWRVIRITDEPIATIDEVDELSTGEIGELIVRGPQVSPTYVTRVEANAVAKIGSDSSTEHSVQGTRRDEHAPFPTPRSPLPPWHRTGDVGYVDDRGRFWYCGRKSQCVVTASGTLYTECVEAVVNRDPGVRRSALVGIGPRGQQVPVIVAERSGNRANRGNSSLLESIQLQQPTREIQAILFRHTLPVDIRHNAKINREYLAAWAARRLPELG